MAFVEPGNDSAKISHQDALRAAMLLNTSIKSVSFYPPAHQAVRQPLEELATLFADVLRNKAEIFLGIVEGVFFLDEHIFVTPNASVAEMADRLIRMGVDAVTVFRGVSFEDLFTFSTLLSRRDSTAANLPDRLTEKGVASICLGIEQFVHDGGDTDFDSARAYSDALHAVRGVMKDIENGRIPNVKKIDAAVDNMVSMAVKDHTTLLGLSMIKDYDNYTFTHSVNVGVLALALGAFMGLGRDVLREINVAGLLHDIGKTRIEKNILNKPGKLTAAEYDIMKKHVETGAEIVGKMEGVTPRIAEAVLGHHIRHNRKGYPEWARGRSFGEVTEIVAVADCYDAMTTLRVYSTPITPKDAIDNIRSLAGSSLDGDLTQKFTDMMGKYPVGALVRLDTNEIAVVTRPNSLYPEAPEVKVAMDAAGITLKEGRKEKLLRDDGSRYARIVAVVDPLLKGIDVARYLVG